MKNKTSLLIWLIFEAFALSLYVSTKNLFYLFNFTYIGTCIGVGTSLMSSKKKVCQKFCTAFCRIVYVDLFRNHLSRKYAD